MKSANQLKKKAIPGMERPLTIACHIEKSL
jgi:hypothetical protein